MFVFDRFMLVSFLLSLWNTQRCRNILHQHHYPSSRIKHFCNALMPQQLKSSRWRAASYSMVQSNEVTSSSFSQCCRDIGGGLPLLTPPFNSLFFYSCWMSGHSPHKSSKLFKERRNYFSHQTHDHEIGTFRLYGTINRSHHPRRRNLTGHR